MSPEEAVKSGALAVERESRGTLLVTGPDRQSWLQGILSCEVAKLKPGEGAFGLCLSKTGKILSDVYLVVTESAVYVSVAPGRAAELVTFLDRMLIMEDAELSDVSAEFTWFVLHGPVAATAASSVAGAHGGHAAGIAFTDLGGAALLVPRAARDAARASLSETQNVVLGDEQAWARFRIPHGLPEYGVDYADNVNPHEAALEHKAVSWTKGCYLGQEVVCMQDMRGKVKRRLVTLELEGGEVPAAGAEVADPNSGEAVGSIKSAVPTGEGKVAAMAELKNAYTELNTQVLVLGRPARVSV